MRVAYRHIRPVSVVYVRSTGCYQTSAVDAWRKLDHWLVQSEMRRRMKRGFGLFHDNPQVTAPELLRYDACADIGTGIDAVAATGIDRQTLPGGTYAMHIHVGAYEPMGQLLSELHREWVPKQGLVVDYDRPFVAIHLNDPRMTREMHRRTELCVPVLPLKQLATSEAGIERNAAYPPPAGAAGWAR